MRTKSLKIFMMLVLAPVFSLQAGLFGSSKEKLAIPLPKELGSLRTAYMFADDNLKDARIEENLMAELDAKIGGEWLEKNAGNTEELAKMREKIFRENGNLYVPSSTPGTSLYSFEIWKRSNQAAQNLLLQDLKLSEEEVKKGYKSSHHLNEYHVPYGGYFFPDNHGGIARRWNNSGLAMDEIVDYKTFHERSQDEINASASKKVKELKEKNAEGYAKFEKTCKEEKYAELSPAECFQALNAEWTKAETERIVVAKVKALSATELNGLSPTEKYDLANGYYDFRTTLFEKYYKGKRRKPSTKNAPFLSFFMFNLNWEGRCNADRACGICNRHNEPVHQLTVDVEEIGQKLVFEPLDIKALFMSTYFYVEKYAMMGARNTPGESDNEVPPNMAAFDALLRGVFQKGNLPFVIDNHNNETVNNVTVIGFDRKVASVRKIKGSEKKVLAKRLEDAVNLAKEDKPANLKNFGDGKDATHFQNELELYKKLTSATKVMQVKTKLTVLSEVPLAEANGPTKAAIVNKGKYTKEEDLVYELYLNDNNEIVEGKYISGNMDFIWFAEGKGTEEDQKKGNKHIKWETMKEMALKSSQKAQEIDRKIFPGKKN